MEKKAVKNSIGYWRGGRIFQSPFRPLRKEKKSANGGEGSVEGLSNFHN